MHSLMLAAGVSVLPHSIADTCIPSLYCSAHHAAWNLSMLSKFSDQSPSSQTASQRDPARPLPEITRTWYETDDEEAEYRFSYEKETSNPVVVRRGGEEIDD